LNSDDVPWRNFLINRDFKVFSSSGSDNLPSSPVCTELDDEVYVEEEAEEEEV